MRASNKPHGSVFRKILLAIGIVFVAWLGIAAVMLLIHYSSDTLQKAVENALREGE